MRSHYNPNQTDFFRAPVFAPRERAERLDASLFRLRIKQAMSRALSDCSADREQVAADMARMLDQPGLSKTMLDTYTSPSKDHDISLVRFKALARAASAPSLWDVAVSDEGLFLLQGDEPRLAEIARLQQARREINAEISKLSALPVQTRRY